MAIGLCRCSGISPVHGEVLGAATAIHFVNQYPDLCNFCRCIPPLDIVVVLCPVRSPKPYISAVTRCLVKFEIVAEGNIDACLEELGVIATSGMQRVPTTGIDIMVSEDSEFNTAFYDYVQNDYSEDAFEYLATCGYATLDWYVGRPFTVPSY